MTGSLQIKNNKYYAVISIMKDGKQKLKWIATGLDKNCDKKERERKLSEILYNFSNNELNCNNTNIKFSDYIKVWLKEAKIKTEEVTYQHYENDANNHIIPYFNKLGIKLKDVTRQVIQDYINEKYYSGRLDGKGGLSPKTLRHHKNIIHQSLELAVLNNLIASNPCEKITMPKLERNVYEFYNSEEIKLFLEATKNEPLYPLYYLTVLYGLRRSEVLGLKWDSIDLLANRITIEHTVTKCNNIIEADKTKTKSSHRSFPITEEVNNILVKLKNEEKTNKKLFGKEYIKNNYIFKWDNGKPYDPDYITHRFAKDIKKYDLKKITFHGLRHSCGSLLNELGYTLKDIQEWLGHADIQTTANIYLHLDTKRKENISNNLNDILK